MLALGFLQSDPVAFLGGGLLAMNFFVVICCPLTGREVPTGLVTDISRFANFPDGKTTLKCPDCGRTHEWAREDVTLAHSLESLDSFWSSVPRQIATAPIDTTADSMPRSASDGTNTPEH
jgi:hypothetical protein